MARLYPVLLGWDNFGDEWLAPINRAFAHYRAYAVKDKTGYPLFNLSALWSPIGMWRIGIDGGIFHRSSAPAKKYWVDYADKFDVDEDQSA